tara:strand:+ start:271 stop:462 length:192 start_codon:yes stop_codon:yes gene_type:complete
MHDLTLLILKTDQKFAEEDESLGDKKEQGKLVMVQDGHLSGLVEELLLVLGLNVTTVKKSTKK